MLRLWQVEGQAVTLGNTCDQKGNKSKELGYAKPHITLSFHNCAHTEAASEHDHTHQRQPHKDFVADHLGGAAQTPQQRVLVIGGETAQQNAVNRERGHTEKEQQTNIDIDNVKVWPERDDGKSQQHRHYYGGRREYEDQAIGKRRHPVMLGKQLDHVGQNLENTHRSQSVWPIAILPDTQ